MAFECDLKIHRGVYSLCLQGFKKIKSIREVLLKVSTFEGVNGFMFVMFSENLKYF